jgi:hypothetical protein
MLAQSKSKLVRNFAILAAVVAAPVQSAVPIDVAAAIGATTLRASADTPASCADPASPMGADGAWCVDTSLISNGSYCLRSSGHKPAHERGQRSPDALVTFGDAKTPLGAAVVDGYDAPQAGDPCYDPTFAPFMAPGDHITISRSRGGLVLQISDEAAQRDRFAPALDLQPDPAGGAFYWSGSRDGVDYFVLLADDQLGQLGRLDADSVPRIEHYYRIEAFRQDWPPDSACHAERPDTPASPETGLNFFTWRQGDATCDILPALQQNGSSGGSHGIP